MENKAEVIVVEEESKTNMPSMVVTPAQMLSIAVEQGADLDKLEKLMDLQERWEAKEAKKAFAVALSEFMATCPMIVKTKQGHNSKYAGLAESIEQIKPSMSAVGLSHSWKTTQNNGIIRITCELTHSSGHTESTSLESSPEKSGSKNDIQAIGSAVEYLKRYTLFAILGLSSGDDNDGNKTENEMKTVTKEQAKKLIGAAKSVGKDADYICRSAKINSVEDLWEVRFDACMNHLKSLMEDK